MSFTIENISPTEVMNIVNLEAVPGNDALEIKYYKIANGETFSYFAAAITSVGTYKSMICDNLKTKKQINTFFKEVTKTIEEEFKAARAFIDSLHSVTNPFISNFKFDNNG